VRLGPPRLGAVTLIAIDGPSGAGKSTHADRLAAELGATVVRTDDFATWDDPVAWWPRLRDGVLEPLARGRAGRYTRTEWANGEPRPGVVITVNPPKVLLLEGVSAGRRSIRSQLSALVWVELADPAERLRRAVERDGEQHRDALIAWQQFETGWFAVDGTKAAADHEV
jgi:uridine kinase